MHVADAYDAMTTARAYRHARPLGEVLAELWRHAGSDFDLPSLQALVSVLPRMLASPDATISAGALATPDALESDAQSSTVVAFERRVS